MKYLFLVLLSCQCLFSQKNKSSGYITYQVSLTEPYFYSEDYTRDFEEGVKENRKIDSLMSNVEFGVVFSKEASASFQSKIYSPNSLEYNATYKANVIPEYSYNSKTNISKVSMDYWLKHILITVSLKDKWQIDYKKTKNIDGYKCYYAEYKGKGLWWEFKPEKPTHAWFTPDIPLPFGPLHYNGLPGLIIEMNVENVRYTVTKIAFDKTHNSKLKAKDLSKYELMSEEEFIRDRADIRRKAKQILIGG